MNIPSNAFKWTAQHLQEFAEQKGFGDLVEILREEELDGEYLDMLEHNLERFGPKYGRAVEFYALIKPLLKKAGTSRQKNRPQPKPEENLVDGMVVYCYKCPVCEKAYKTAHGRYAHSKKSKGTNPCSKLV